MNRQQQLKALPLQQAYANGEEVEFKEVWNGVGLKPEWEHYQCHISGHPRVVADPIYEWRVGPTPRSGRMCLTCGSHFVSFTGSDIVHDKRCCGADVIDWIEVLQ